MDIDQGAANLSISLFSFFFFLTALRGREGEGGGGSWGEVRAEKLPHPINTLKQLVLPRDTTHTYSRHTSGAKGKKKKNPSVHTVLSFCFVFSFAH